MYFPLKNAIYNTANIGIGIGSVSADLKKRISVIYRIGRFKKWDLSVYIGIGQYEKKFIGRTLDQILLRSNIFSFLFQKFKRKNNPRQKFKRKYNPKLRNLYINQSGCKWKKCQKWLKMPKNVQIVFLCTQKTDI